MNWIEVENTTGRKIPRWKRSAALADNGTVFVPAALSGNEQVAVLSASWDGVSMVMNLNHAFPPSSWLSQEYPDTREICEKIERKVREIISSSSSDQDSNFRP